MMNDTVPVEKRQAAPSKRTIFPVRQWSLVICRNTFKESKHFGKWLAVLETEGKGWWLPGGGVDAGELPDQAAKRECIEEAGMKIEIKGMLSIESFPPQAESNKNATMMRFIYYAEPVSLEAAENPKDTADRESILAAWKTLDELIQFQQ